MRILDYSAPTPAGNLACDEALLDWFEAGENGGLLRFWEPDRLFVVVGYANHAAVEADTSACEAAGVPVLRRCTGGGTVLQGPGCLNYTLILDIGSAPPLASIAGTNMFVMERHRAVMQRLLDAPVEICGDTDLAVGGRKFSGNAQRRRRRCLMFHGTFLLRFDLPLMRRFLGMPSREPGYRRGRSHDDFLTNIRPAADTVKHALAQAWDATERLDAIPDFSRLEETRYGLREWNFKW